MLTHGSILVSLLWLVEQIPAPPPPVKRQRGRQSSIPTSSLSERLIVMIIRRLSTGLCPASLSGTGRSCGTPDASLAEGARTFSQSAYLGTTLARLPQTLPSLIACLGAHLVRDQAVGRPGMSRHHRQYRFACQGRRLAQERPLRVSYRNLD